MLYQIFAQYSFDYSRVTACFVIWGGLWAWLFWRRRSQFTIRQAIVMFTGFAVILAVLRAASPGPNSVVDPSFDDWGELKSIITILLVWVIGVNIVLIAIEPRARWFEVNCAVQKKLAGALRLMRLHFTIRDLLWLTAVVALALAWWLDHSDLFSTAAIDHDFEAKCKARVDNVVELLEANKARTELEHRRVDQLWGYIRYIHDNNPDL